MFESSLESLSYYSRFLYFHWTVFGKSKKIKIKVCFNHISTQKHLKGYCLSIKNITKILIKVEIKMPDRTQFTQLFDQKPRENTWLWMPNFFIYFNNYAALVMNRNLWTQTKRNYDVIKASLLLIYCYGIVNYKNQ